MDLVEVSQNGVTKSSTASSESSSEVEFFLESTWQASNNLTLHIF